ncbi:MAG: stage II sporulation protein [Dictyoglomus sp. NZ13-RE01]|nr:MAG: stage II sporulation protein [Dictyoglomus sp. NZ13-RE01]
MLTCKIYYAYKNKEGEEVCGDTIKIKRDEKKVAITVSDGLGSGIKASILSTLTASMATTMLFNNIPIEDTLKSILATLPVCKVRGISYANFVNLLFEREIDTLHIVEYEFPAVLFFRGNQYIPIPKDKQNILDKEIFYTNIQVEAGDIVFVMTDGVIQAGLGSKNYPLGFGLDNVKREIRNLLLHKIAPQEIVQYLIDKTKKLDFGLKGDDALVCSLYFRPYKQVNVLVGPPSSPDLDEMVVNKFINLIGSKVICGGTTAQIVSKYLNKEIRIDLHTISDDSPPIGIMEGIDLITEGIITLTQVFRFLDGQDSVLGYGARILLDLLLDADCINFMVGKAINPVYQNPLFCYDISIKVRIVEDIARILRNKGKLVSIEYF